MKNPFKLIWQGDVNDINPKPHTIQLQVLKSTRPQSTLAYIWYGIIYDVYINGDRVVSVSEDFYTYLSFALESRPIPKSRYMKRSLRKRIQGIVRRIKEWWAGTMSQGQTLIYTSGMNPHEQDNITGDGDDDFTTYLVTSPDWDQRKDYLKTLNGFYNSQDKGD